MIYCFIAIFLSIITSISCFTHNVFDWLRSRRRMIRLPWIKFRRNRSDLTRRTLKSSRKFTHTPFFKRFNIRLHFAIFSMHNHRINSRKYSYVHHLFRYSGFSRLLNDNQESRKSFITNETARISHIYWISRFK